MEPDIYEQLKETIDVSQPDERINLAEVFAGLDKSFSALGVQTNPPLEDTDIARLEKELPCRIPPLLKELYKWHDGIQSFLPYCDFLSLAEMVKRYHFIKQIDREVGASDGEGWPVHFLPILEFDGRTHIALDCALPERNPLYYYFVEDGIPHPRYRGIGHLLAVTLTAYETGAYHKRHDILDVRPIGEMQALRTYSTASELQAMEENWVILEKALTHLRGQEFRSIMSWIAHKVPDERMVPLLRQRLHDADPDTVAGAAFALGQLQAQAALPDLTDLLSHPASKVRNFAGGALSELDSIDSEITIDRLIALLDDRDDLVRISAIEALGRAKSPRPVPHLIKRLPKSRPGIQEYIVRTLAYLGDKSALPALRELQTAVSRMNLNEPNRGGSRGSDPPPVRLKAGVDWAISQLGG